MRTKTGNKGRKILAIFASDIHLRETAPECRTDDFFLAQLNKLRWLKQLQEQNNCPVLIAGDLFHKWKPSPWLLGFALRELPDKCVCIPGQHDLPAHNLEQIEKSGIEVLASAGKITLLEPARSLQVRGEDFSIIGFPWGIELENCKRNGRFKIALIHKLIYKAKEPPFPGAEEVGSTAKALAKKLSGFDVIVTGDNHQTIFETYGETTVVNCGSFMRSTAAQVDHEPSVFVLYDDFVVKRLSLPFPKGVISREHIDKVQEKDERIAAFAERLSARIEIGLSYASNMEKYIAKNKISKSVQSIIWRAIDGKK